MTQLLIEIPDDIARLLEGMAGAQDMSIEQLAVERLRSLVTGFGSASTVLRAVSQPPRPDSSSVDDLEAAIADSQLPVVDRGAFEN